MQNSVHTNIYNSFNTEYTKVQYTLEDQLWKQKSLFKLIKSEITLHLLVSGKVAYFSENKERE